MVVDLAPSRSPLGAAEVYELSGTNRVDFGWTPHPFTFSPDPTRAVIEGVIGTGLADYIFGNQQDNVLWGEAGLRPGVGGPDFLVGAGGSDDLQGLFGDDTIVASGDGAADTIDCGEGTNDRAYIDRGLDTALNCERVVYYP